MKYTFEFKLGCVERYKQARMRPSARQQKQKFLQIPRPALGEPGRLDEAERKKITGHPFGCPVRSTTLKVIEPLFCVRA